MVASSCGMSEKPMEAQEVEGGVVQWPGPWGGGKGDVEGVGGKWRGWAGWRVSWGVLPKET